MDVLGTSFVIGRGDDLFLMTAKHVFASNPLGENQRYGALTLPDDGVRDIHEFFADPVLDIGVAPISRKDFPHVAPLRFSKTEPSLNEDIYSFEYSSTRKEKKAWGVEVFLEPYSHKGNIVLSYIDYRTDPAVPSYLASFPALQGSSGAPLFSFGHKRAGLGVVGLLVANVERHLVPAQVVEIKEGDSFSEAISYFLPYGQALARTVLIEFLERHGIPFDWIDLNADPRPRLRERARRRPRWAAKHA